MKTTQMEQLIKLKDKAKKIIAQIAIERNELRTIVGEMEDILEALDDGVDSLNYGIDRISELL